MAIEPDREAKLDAWFLQTEACSIIVRQQRNDLVLPWRTICQAGE
ncbi:hypothetical protein AB0D11_38980 [Streptomyces monashensis]